MTFAYDAYKKYSVTELSAMAAKIKADPKNKSSGDTIYLFTTKATKRLDEIAQAITFHMQDFQLTLENNI